MPSPAEAQYERSAYLAASASQQASVAWGGPTGNLARTVAALQLTAAAGADQYLNNYTTDSEGAVVPLQFAGTSGDGLSLLTLFESAQTQALLQIAAASAVQDAGREAVAAGIAARPAVAGYVRMLSPPSCSRCAVLAGRWYKWNEGFQRHFRCDCIHQPASRAGLTTDLTAMLRQGQVTGLSAADTKAILEDGADFGRVVNARLPTAGGARRGQLLPSDIFRLAGDDRDAALRMLIQQGFIRT